MDNREREIIDGVVQIINQYVPSDKIWLFGSRGKESARKGSDFDFAVQGTVPSRDVQVRIEEAVEKRAGLYEVDIVYLDDADPDFREIVLKTGKVVYERKRT